MIDAELGYVCAGELNKAEERIAELEAQLASLREAVGEYLRLFDMDADEYGNSMLLMLEEAQALENMRKAQEGE